MVFISDDFEKPTDEKSAEFVAWKSNNSTICSWLFNSVDESIQPSVAGHKIAKEMWLDLKERYSINNGPRRNQLKSQYHLLRQNCMSVVSYYNKFKALWDELYGSEDLTCGCTCDAAAKLQARVEREKTHDFVLGLDDDLYGALRTQILSMEPFPALNKAFSLATQEERHRSIIRDRDDKSQALSFAVQASQNSSSLQPNPTSSSPSTCSHCGRTGGRGQQVPAAANTARATNQQHDGDTDPNNGFHQANNIATPPGFTSEQVQHIITLLESSSAFEKLYGKDNNNCLWLLDSGASHHMTGILDDLFDRSDLPPCPVSLPDGWKVLDLETNEIFVSRDVRFLEDTFPFSHESTEPSHAEHNQVYADLDFGDLSSYPVAPNVVDRGSVSPHPESSPASPLVRSSYEDGAVLARAPDPSQTMDAAPSSRNIGSATVPSETSRVRRPPSCDFGGVVGSSGGSSVGFCGFGGKDGFCGLRFPRGGGESYGCVGGFAGVEEGFWWVRGFGVVGLGGGCGWRGF
uniref:Retroviral polymerase SH3-like domain-containing protein n=1 Tax=Chenopodium quinoa TaxID=63459 RepID=A0A803LHS0_CHEQI